MSEDYLAQQQPTLIWNSARGVWEKAGMANLLCEHWELFSETWPTSGMMRNGQVFELPMQVRHTTVSESSLLRSPTASQGEGGALGEETARERGNTVGIRDQAMDLAQLNGAKVSRVERNLMPTPNTMDHLPARDPSKIDKSKGGYANVRETVVNELMPTPTTMDAKATNDYDTAQKFLLQGRQTCLTYELIPTPMSRDYKGDTAPHERNGVVQTDTVERAIFHSGEVSSTNWGKFEPAIRRWEQVLGRSAPLPTKPDGKDGAHRLSSAFTEWMMGVPEGWITGVGLSRNDELKACGNGVVPQQAELALKILLEGIVVQSKPGGGQTVLPTPTVMDQRDGKHFRSVAIKNLAEGANRGLNLNNIIEAGLTDWQEGDQFEIVAGKAVKKQVPGD